MFKSNILFTGFYGQKNTGDDAFIEVSSWGAKKYWNKNNNIFLSKKENLPICLHSAKGYPVSLPRSYHLQNNILLRNTEYLISAGGSTIHSKMDKTNVKSMAVALKKKNKKIKLGGIGVSIGPFKTTEDEKAIFEYLKNLDFLAVRDQASYDIVSQLDLPYQPVNAFDLAALLPKVYSNTQFTSNNVESPGNKKIIGISVCRFESISEPNNIAKEDKRNRMLCELLKLLDAQENIHFKFLIINGHNRVGDLSLTQEIITKTQLKSVEIVPYQKKTKTMWDVINTCDFMISTRLHAAIFSCFANIPFMLNEYHKKCGDFIETVGHDTQYRLYDSEYSIYEKSLLILETINNNNYISPKNKEIVFTKAKFNFTKINL